jgi:hypothetical protein
MLLSGDDASALNSIIIISIPVANVILSFISQNYSRLIGCLQFVRECFQHPYDAFLLFQLVRLKRVGHPCMNNSEMSVSPPVLCFD